MIAHVSLVLANPTVPRAVQLVACCALVYELTILRQKELDACTGEPLVALHFDALQYIDSVRSALISM